MAWTGTVPAFIAGERGLASKYQTLSDIATALTARSTWSPTLTNLTLGSGTVVARYHRANGLVIYDFVFILGSGSAVGTGPTFTLPAAPNATLYRTRSPIGWGTIEDAGNADHVAVARWTGSGSVADIVVLGAAATYVNHVGVTASVPFTFGTGDWLHVAGTYEAA